MVVEPFPITDVEIKIPKGVVKISVKIQFYAGKYMFGMLLFPI